MPLIWPSQRIAAAIDDGTILTGHLPDADQVPPASVDLRLGPKACRLPASFLPGPLYGADLRSNDQGQWLKLSKHLS